MKFLPTLIFFILTLGCKKHDINSPQTLVKMVADINTNSSARSLALSDRLIDVDLSKMSKTNKMPDETELSKAKAAIYRFYKHVEISNGYYTTALRGGKEINVSEITFNTLVENLHGMNAFIKECNDKGQKIEVQRIDDKYLESLLR